MSKKMSMEGKIVIVTGSNTGIGKETVRALARDGAKVYLACRDLKKGEEARNEITKETPSAQVQVRQLDLADFVSIRKFAKGFLEEEEKLHILVNNAGIMTDKRQVTKQGLELQFGVNHIGHVLLTDLLLEALKKAAPSRIVVVSSMAHSFGKINFDDINSEKSYSKMGAYAQTKLANILFTRELARRLQGTGVTANSLHPGGVTTQMTSGSWLFSNPLVKLFMKTAEQGAATSLYVATNPKLEGVTGKYFSDCKEKEGSAKSKDDKVAVRLWTLSEEIIAKHSE